VVWVGKDRTKASFGGFFDALGPARAAQVQAISLDGSSIYLPVARERIPQATICLDPFHVIGWTNEVVDSVYRTERPKLALTGGHSTCASGAEPATHCAPAPNASTTPIARFSTRCAAAATGSGAPGNSKNNSATSIAPCTPPTPAPISNAGAPPRCAAAFPRSGTWSAACANTSMPWSPRSNSACPTPASKASTPTFGSSSERGYGHRNLDSLTASIYLCLGGITINPPTES
jgi:transposase